MKKVKYLLDEKPDSAGHVNNIVALDSATLHHIGNVMRIEVKLNRYKDTEAKLSGKSPSIDRVQPEHLFDSELRISPLELHNSIIEVIAKKHNLEVIEVKEELLLLSPTEQREEKEKREKKEKGKSEKAEKGKSKDKKPANGESEKGKSVDK